MKPVAANLHTAHQKLLAAHPLPTYVAETTQEVIAIAALLQAVHPAPARLLDIGCGALDKTGMMQFMGYSCCACDDFQDPWHRRDDNLHRLQEFAASTGICLHVQGDDHAILWEPESFDVITLFSIIEHLCQSPRELLNTAGRYLRPGGTVVIVTPNSVNLRKRVDVMRGRTNYPPLRGFYENVGVWRGHVREYTLTETRQVMEWSGFAVTAATTFHGFESNVLRGHPLRSLYLALSALLPTLKDGIFVAGRKSDDWQPTEFSEERARETLAPGVPEAVR